MSGPSDVLVDISSATQSRSAQESKPYYLQAINRSHSELVKFSQDDECYTLVRGKIEDMAEVATDTIRKRFESEIAVGTQPITITLQRENSVVDGDLPLDRITKSIHKDSLDRQSSKSGGGGIFKKRQHIRPGGVGTPAVLGNPLLSFPIQASQPNQPVDPEKTQSSNIRTFYEKDWSLREAFLTTLESRESHLSTEYGPARHSGTCEWFLRTDEYSNWLTLAQPQTLVITAPTGRGKSVLAKYVASKLQQSSEDYTVLSYFCKEGQNTRQKAMVIVRSLLYDLLVQRQELLLYVPRRDLVSEGEKAMTFQSLWEILMHILRSTSQSGTVCIIDGLDECDEDSRRLLQEAFERDVLSSDPAAEQVKVRFLITSQPIKSALLLAQRSIYFNIRPDHVNKDIVEYVCAGIQMLRKVGPQAGMAKDLADEIEEAIKKRADGSFQWAKLVLKEMKDVPVSRNSISKILQVVPKGLESVYENCFRKISEQEAPKARKILTALLFASRALTPKELAICILDDPVHYRTHSEIENDFDHSIGWTASVACGSFLDVSDKTINITHQSARQSLLSFSAEHSSAPDFVPFEAEDGHRLLAISCLSYLLLDDFKSDQKHEDDVVGTASFPFLGYAEANWAVHLRNVSDLDGLENILQRFFSRSVFRKGPWETVWPRMLEHFPRLDGCEDTALLHLIVQTGILSLLKRCKLKGFSSNAIASPILILDTSIEDEDAVGNTALMRAMKNFEGKVACWLIFERNADANTVDDQGTTIPHLAVLADDASLIRLLRVLNVNLNRMDGFGSTPFTDALHFGCERAAAMLLNTRSVRTSRYSFQAFHLSALKGYDDLVRAFLRFGHKVNSVSPKKETALMLASKAGHYNVVKILLSEKADPDMKDNRGMSALHYAAQGGKGTIVEVLLEQHVLPDDGDKDSRTPLHFAAAGGFEDVVRRLIPHVNLDGRCNDGDNALLLAVGGNHLDVVTELANKGASINQTSSKGLTPFHLAVYLGHEDIAHFLAAQKGALLDTVDLFGATPLFEAAKKGDKAIVQLLIHYGAEVDGRAEFVAGGDTAPPLHCAAGLGHLEIAKSLVGAHASINKAWDGWTPVLAGADENHTDVVNFLLDEGADPHCVTNYGWGLLHYVARAGNRALVNRLLSGGVDISGRNMDGRTAVYYACASGSVETLRELLEKGADLKSASNSGFTLLLVAVSHEHRDMVQYLLNMKEDVNQAYDKNVIPLGLAAGKENLAILKLLLENGARCHEPLPNAWTPLHEAASLGLANNVALLLRYKHPVDATNKSGATPLLVAAANGHIIVVKALLDFGANIKAVSKNGVTFLEGAAHSRSATLFRIGIDKGADINELGQKSRAIATAIQNGDYEFFRELFIKGARCPREADSQMWGELHDAAAPGHLNIVRDLLNAGFDPNARDIFGRTPLHVAAMCYRKATVRMLIEHGGDLRAIDCYGRTAHYWARRRFNHGLRDCRYAAVVLELEPSHRRQRLEQCIRFCIERLLQYPDYDGVYHVLGKCLQFEGDMKNARIAFEQRMDETKRPKMVHTPTCNVCGPHKGIEGYRYVCESCADIDLCSQCFNESWDPGLIGKGCHAHAFLTVPSADWVEHPAGVVNAEGLTVREWLLGLRPAKSTGLQDPNTGAWSRVEQQMQSPPGYWDLIDTLYEHHAPEICEADSSASSSVCPSTSSSSSSETDD